MSNRDLTRKSKLYEQGQKFRSDRLQDEIELERDPLAYSFVPNSGTVTTKSASAAKIIRKKGP